jgi:uncharacterized protein (DUF58 family)
MRTLLKEFWSKYQFRSKFVATPEGDEWGLKALRIAYRDSHDTTIALYLEQRIFIAAMLVPLIYVFAGETTNQWFYLICAGVITAIALGLIIPLMQVLDVRAFCSLPNNSMAGDSVLLKITLERKAHNGLFSTAFPVKWLLVRANLVANNGKSSVLKPMLVEHVGVESWVFAATSPLRRGVYKLHGIEIYSCFPLGLTWWSRTFELRTENEQAEQDRPTIVVYPKTVPIEGNFLYKIRSATDSPMGLVASRKSTNVVSSSVRGVREFVHGDSPRLIHWASSARVGRLLVREFEAEGLPGFDILLNLRANWVNRDQFELAVSIVLSLMNLGYKLGGAPDLLVVPTLDGENKYLPYFMKDMPTLPSGLARTGHLLARVEPLKQGKASATQTTSLGESTHQALLTIRPTTSEDADSNLIIETVDLAVIPRTWEAALAQEAQSIKEAHMPVHEGGIVNRRGSGKSTGRVITVIETLEEVVRL